MDIHLFVMSYLIQLLASVILLYRVLSVKSIYGLSIDTQICILAATISRCIWSINTRIVESDILVATVASLELLLSLGASVFLFGLFRKLSHTTTVGAPLACSAIILVPAAFLLALIFNPGASFVVTSQTMVAFTMYVEALALIPQLWIIRKMDDVEALTSHYIGLLVVSRIARMMFWLVMFSNGQGFMSLFLADVVHTILSGDYLYLWVRKLRYGGRLVYSI